MTRKFRLAICMHKPVGLCTAICTTVVISIISLTLLSAVQTAAGYEFQARWGSYGEGQSQFNQPTDLAVGSDGNVYIADGYNERVQVYGPRGEFILMFGYDVVTGGSAGFEICAGYPQICQKGARGNGNGQFHSPSGVAISSSGDIYVADSQNNRVQVFGSNGSFKTQFGQSYIQNAGGVALDKNDNAYVVDTENRQIDVFDSTHSYKISIGFPILNTPADVEIGLDTADGKRSLYIPDSASNNVRVFDSDGRHLGSWDGSNSPSVFRYPNGVGIDGQGNVFVADTINHRIAKFGAWADYLDSWGSFGAEDGLFKFPGDVAVGGDQSVYVADTFKPPHSEVHKDGRRR